VGLAPVSNAKETTIMHWWEIPTTEQAAEAARPKAVAYYRYSDQDRQENSIAIQHTGSRTTGRNCRATVYLLLRQRHARRPSSPHANKVMLPGSGILATRKPMLKVLFAGLLP